MSDEFVDMETTPINVDVDRVIRDLAERADHDLSHPDTPTLLMGGTFAAYAAIGGGIVCVFETSDGETKRFRVSPRMLRMFGTIFGGRGAGRLRGMFGA